MIGGEQPKLILGTNENGELIISKEQAELLGLYETPQWRLIRDIDGLTKESEKILWVELNEDGTFKEKFDEIAVDRSLIMSPFNQSFTWQTTTITEVIANREDYKEFKTKNSHYRLFKLDDNISVASDLINASPIEQLMQDLIIELQKEIAGLEYSFLVDQNNANAFEVKNQTELMEKVESMVVVVLNQIMDKSKIKLDKTEKN